MVLPLLPLLMGGSALFSGATSLYNLANQRRIYSREEQFSRKQSSDLNRWVSDYRKNTGLIPKYPYLGMSGQARYMDEVRLPNYGNIYAMNTSSMFGSAARTAFGMGFAYDRYRGSYYRPISNEEFSNNPSRVMYG